MGLALAFRVPRGVRYHRPMLAPVARGVRVFAVVVLSLASHGALRAECVRVPGGWPTVRAALARAHIVFEGEVLDVAVEQHSEGQQVRFKVLRALQGVKSGLGPVRSRTGARPTTLRQGGASSFTRRTITAHGVRCAIARGRSPHAS